VFASALPCLNVQVQQYLSEASELAHEEGHQALTPVHLAVVMFEDAQGVGRQAVVKAGGDEAWKSLCRTLRRRLVRLPKIEPPPDEVSRSLGWAATGSTWCGRDTAPTSMLPCACVVGALCGHAASCFGVKFMSGSRPPRVVAVFTSPSCCVL